VNRCWREQFRTQCARDRVVCTENSDSHVVVMQSAEERL
jgi:hypothetical protein